MDKLKNSEGLTRKKYKESVYYGELKNRKKHGVGIMMYINGKVYEGAWENDQKQGYGIEKLTNGAIYQGYFEKGKPHGRGSYLWPSG